MSFFLSGIMHRYMMHSENVIYGKRLGYVIKWVTLGKWSWEQWIFYTLLIYYLFLFGFITKVYTHKPLSICFREEGSSRERTRVRKLFNSRPRVIKSSKMKEFFKYSEGVVLIFPRRHVTQWMKWNSAYQSNLTLDLTMTAGQEPGGSPGTSQQWVTPEIWQLPGTAVAREDQGLLQHPPQRMTPGHALLLWRAILFSLRSPGRRMAMGTLGSSSPRTSQMESMKLLLLWRSTRTWKHFRPTQWALLSSSGKLRNSERQR